MATRAPKSTPLPERSDRSRLWQAMRILVEFTPDDVVKTTETNVKAAREFVRALTAAGVLRRLATSNGRHGSCRYRLIRNLGPLAPRTGLRGVQDPNSGAFLEYAPGTMALAPSRRRGEAAVVATSVAEAGHE